MNENKQLIVPNAMTAPQRTEIFAVVHEKAQTLRLSSKTEVFFHKMIMITIQSPCVAKDIVASKKKSCFLLMS